MQMFRCEKCRAEKSAREFELTRADETVIRSDCCLACCREIAALRRCVDRRERRPSQAISGNR